ncbi:ABC transporter permease [Fulvimarina sp. 2208YS6-2-32]|uniref:ABC transporter permease n=1 Tax=Fulvimarina uroteuthidis TaxID=3098149 RepID=A0ABU5I1M1_9HYPH|nr:ABC transporter permease [Fulvimarina sp. 2208YS6-2-32]MDY8108873.1 ABC transporter permease [Fulvimarina sp. 2208YS6-2-32]
MPMAEANAVPVKAARHRTPTGRMAVAWQDFREGVAMRELWIFLGWRDVRKHYRRSVIGPFWLTLSMGIMVASLGFLYSQIFGMDISTYLPFLAVGFIMWGFISGTVTAACNVFSGAAGSIRQIRLPLSVYIYQFVWSQLINLAHNFLIYLIVLLIFGIPISWSILLFIPALALYVLNGVFAVMVLGPLCARFRDIPMIVSSFVQVIFFMTPILWSAEQIPQRVAFVALNPFYHFIEIARDPLLGGTGTLTNWIACMVLTILFGLLATAFFARYRSRIPYWA